MNKILKPKDIHQASLKSEKTDKKLVLCDEKTKTVFQIDKAFLYQIFWYKKYKTNF